MKSALRIAWLCSAGSFAITMFAILLGKLDVRFESTPLTHIFTPGVLTAWWWTGWDDYRGNCFEVWALSFCVLINVLLSWVIGLVVGGVWDVINSRRTHALTCLNCGYDLRHLPKDRCPECGCSASN